MFSSSRAALRRAYLFALATVIGATSVLIGVPATDAQAVEFARISGSGSSWAANAVSYWVANGQKFGWVVDYNPNGSSRGRTDFLTGQVDFAVSDIPFQFNPTDSSAPERPAPGSYAYMPIVAGGTSFMYNLKIGGRRVTNLRLSGENIARIFAGQVTKWNDPKIAADNPGLKLPATTVVPVTRADGSGSSAQFSLWMSNQYPSIWNSIYPKGPETSLWPNIKGGQPKVGDDGVANYVKQAYGDGSIGYVQYSYAKNAGFPVAKMLNKAGYYVEPTPQNVAVALLKAAIQDKDPSNLATYLTQQLDGVYKDTDPRTYPMSSYSYAILPLTKTSRYADAKAATLGAFGKYLLCNGQDGMADLGYSPLPLNLVTRAFAQLKKSPGTNLGNLDPVKDCKNPTFSADGSNQLAKTAPFPPACDKQGPTQCATGTGGAQAETPTRNTSGGSSSGGTGGGGSTSGGSGSTSGGGSGGSASSSSSGGGSAGTSGTSESGADGTDSGATVDPETGLQVGSGGGGAAEVPLAGPVSLNSASDGGWSGSQTFAILGGLMLLAVFVLPPLLVKRLSRGNPR
jgi:phosphate ABC transporter phosphate-binding protein